MLNRLIHSVHYDNSEAFVGILKGEVEKNAQKDKTLDLSSYTDDLGNTVLHHAVISGNRDKVYHLLINYPRIVYSKNSNNLSALHYSILLDFIDISKLLIKLYPNLLYQKSGPDNDLSVIDIAFLCFNNNFRELIATDYPDYYLTLLSQSKYHENINLFNLNGTNNSYLIPVCGMLKDIYRIDEQIIINCLLGSNEIKLIQTFLHIYPVVLNNWNIKGRNLFAEALIKERTDIVSYIVENFPLMLEMFNKDGNNALHYAILYNEYNIVKEIIVKRPDLMRVPNMQGIKPTEMVLNKHDKIKSLFSL
jgi:ankyrin repeat protein